MRIFGFGKKEPPEIPKVGDIECYCSCHDWKYIYEKYDGLHYCSKCKSGNGCIITQKIKRGESIENDYWKGTENLYIQCYLCDTKNLVKPRGRIKFCNKCGADLKNHEICKKDGCPVFVDGIHKCFLCNITFCKNHMNNHKCGDKSVLKSNSPYKFQENAICSICNHEFSFNSVKIFQVFENQEKIRKTVCQKCLYDRAVENASTGIDSNGRLFWDCAACRPVRRFFDKEEYIRHHWTVHS